MTASIGRLGQGLDGRKAVEEALVERLDRRDRRLLQHDLGQPDPIGIGGLAGPGAPRQVAPVAVVPGEKIGGFGLGGALGARLACGVG